MPSQAKNTESSRVLCSSRTCERIGGRVSCSDQLWSPCCFVEADPCLASDRACSQGSLSPIACMQAPKADRARGLLVMSVQQRSRPRHCLEVNCPYSRGPAQTQMRAKQMESAPCNTCFLTETWLREILLFKVGSLQSDPNLLSSVSESLQPCKIRLQRARCSNRQSATRVHNKGGQTNVSARLCFVLCVLSMMQFDQ